MRKNKSSSTLKCRRVDADTNSYLCKEDALPQRRGRPRDYKRREEEFDYETDYTDDDADEYGLVTVRKQKNIPSKAVGLFAPRRNKRRPARARVSEPPDYIELYDNEPVFGGDEDSNWTPSRDHSRRRERQMDYYDRPVRQWQVPRHSDGSTRSEEFRVIQSDQRPTTQWQEPQGRGSRNVYEEYGSQRVPRFGGAADTRADTHLLQQQPDSGTFVTPRPDQVGGSQQPAAAAPQWYYDTPQPSRDQEFRPLRLSSTQGPPMDAASPMEWHQPVNVNPTASTSNRPSSSDETYSKLTDILNSMAEGVLGTIRDARLTDVEYTLAPKLLGVRNISDLESKTSTLAIGLTEGVKMLVADIDNCRSTVSNLSVRAQRVERELAEARSGLDARLEQVTRELAESERSLTEARNNLDICRRQKEVSVFSSQNSPAIANLESRIRELDTDVSMKNANLSALQSRISDLETSLQASQELNDRNSNLIRGLRTELEESRRQSISLAEMGSSETTITEAMDRIKKLQDQQERSDSELVERANAYVEEIGKKDKEIARLSDLNRSFMEQVNRLTTELDKSKTGDTTTRRKLAEESSDLRKRFDDLSKEHRLVKLDLEAKNSTYKVAAQNSQTILSVLGDKIFPSLRLSFNNESDGDVGRDMAKITFAISALERALVPVRSEQTIGGPAAILRYIRVMVDEFLEREVSRPERGFTVADFELFAKELTDGLKEAATKRNNTIKDNVEIVFRLSQLHSRLLADINQLNLGVSETQLVKADERPQIHTYEEFQRFGNRVVDGVADSIRKIGIVFNKLNSDVQSQRRIIDSLGAAGDAIRSTAQRHVSGYRALFESSSIFNDVVNFHSSVQRSTSNSGDLIRDLETLNTLMTMMDANARSGVYSQEQLGKTETEVAVYRRSLGELMENLGHSQTRLAITSGPGQSETSPLDSARTLVADVYTNGSERKTNIVDLFHEALAAVTEPSARGVYSAKIPVTPRSMGLLRDQVMSLVNAYSTLESRITNFMSEISNTISAVDYGDSSIPGVSTMDIALSEPVSTVSTSRTAMTEEQIKSAVKTLVKYANLFKTRTINLSNSVTGTTKKLKEASLEFRGALTGKIGSIDQTLDIATLSRAQDETLRQTAELDLEVTNTLNNLKRVVGIINDSPANKIDMGSVGEFFRAMLRLFAKVSNTSEDVANLSVIAQLSQSEPLALMSRDSLEVLKNNLETAARIVDGLFDKINSELAADRPNKLDSLKNLPDYVTLLTEVRYKRIIQPYLENLTKVAQRLETLRDKIDKSFAPKEVRKESMDVTEYVDPDLRTAVSRLENLSQIIYESLTKSDSEYGSLWRETLLKIKDSVSPTAPTPTALIELEGSILDMTDKSLNAVKALFQTFVRHSSRTQAQKSVSFGDLEPGSEPYTPGVMAAIEPAYDNPSSLVPFQGTTLAKRKRKTAEDAEY